MRAILSVFLLAATVIAEEQQPPSSATSITSGIPYRVDQTDSYATEKCQLDIHRPLGVTNAPVVVWFHGGGLTKGERAIPKALMHQGIVVVAAGYRLSPQVKCPTYLEDAAAAVAWTIRNAEQYGGSSRRVFISGHSAGAYLSAMVGLDRSWLARHDLDANQLAGIIPFSGQAITHFTIRDERGIPDTRPVIDEFAPLFHVRSDAAPILLITGDRDRELLGRYEENAYLYRMLQEVKHPDTDLFELQGFDHGGMAEPAFPLLLKFVRQHSTSER
ncbi:MAG: alpha/beta hydrolase [Planctomycetota bacterium]